MTFQNLSVYSRLGMCAPAGGSLQIRRAKAIVGPVIRTAHMVFRPSFLIAATLLSAASATASDAGSDDVVPTSVAEVKKEDSDSYDDDDEPVEKNPWSAELTSHNIGVGFGNAPHIDGLRLNFRDSPGFAYKVHGVNLSIWMPKRNFGGDVVGVAIGLPATGVNRLTGLGIGLGLGFQESAEGLLIGPFGIGAGGSLRGISLAGLGLGAGQNVDGLSIAGLGGGAGGSVRGLALAGGGFGAGGDLIGLSIAGLGMGAGDNVVGLHLAGGGLGAGENIKGITVAGLGLGAGENLMGLHLAGVGLGAGENIKGITVAGLGMGAGENLVGIHAASLGMGAGGSLWGLAVAGVGMGFGDDVNGLVLTAGGLGAGNKLRGIMIAGLGMGSGESITGLAVSSLAIGSPHIAGTSVATVVLARQMTGLNISAWLDILPPNAFSRREQGPEGQFTGVSLSVVNRIRGEQKGLAIGLVNYARVLHGVQIGLFNWAGNNAFFKAMPVVNAHFD